MLALLAENTCVSRLRTAASTQKHQPKRGMNCSPPHGVTEQNARQHSRYAPVATRRNGHPRRIVPARSFVPRRPNVGQPDRLPDRDDARGRNCTPYGTADALLGGTLLHCRPPQAHSEQQPVVDAVVGERVRVRFSSGAILVELRRTPPVQQRRARDRAFSWNIEAERIARVSVGFFGTYTHARVLRPPETTS